MIRAARSASLALVGILAASLASAGGPLNVRANGQPYVWSTASAVHYVTDNGPLSATVDEATARARVAGMFAVWQNVPSASISYQRDGFIPGGDVNTVARYDSVVGECNTGSLSPVIYDATGEIVAAVTADDAVIGFAGACAIDVAQGRILSGKVVMNGLFQDGQPTPTQDLTVAEFDATFIHEFGHFSGLGHSQINVECANIACGPDDLAGLPTMFPFLVTAQQGSLSIDDVAWISRLYPASGASGFAATHGTIAGTVFFSDGETPMQFVNVVARQVDTGTNQDRRFAASVVSGFRFRACHSNPITNDPCSESGSESGSDSPGFIGTYEIPAPPGSYTIEFEGIDPQFTDGSSVGPWSRPPPMPGTVPAPLGPVTVTAGATTGGHDIVIQNTPPRFDQFEGP